ncbi:MAG: hypothetical protein AAGI52_02105 [Bacteroidota bacterium]
MRFLLLPLLALASCSLGPGSGDPSFGDAYGVEAQFPVELDGDTLRVTVSYGGGCAEHEFRLRDQRVGGQTEVWLSHDAGGDGCEAYITRRLAVFAGGLDAPPDVLLTPSGERRAVQR